MTRSLTRPLAPTVLCALVAAALVAGCGSSSSSASATGSATQTETQQASAGVATGSGTASSSAPQIGFEGVPLQQGPPLAPASTTGTGRVDGISCQTNEQLAYHIHAHLAVFDDGRPYVLPAGVGIPGSAADQTNQGPIAAGGKCIYWLHTHTTDGVIHIESPTKRIYTLGDFFDIWRQPLSSTRVASLHGAITALVNGHPWHRSPRSIPLLAHQDIQLELGQPAPPVVKIDWSQTQL